MNYDSKAQWKNLTSRLTLFAVWIASILIDSVFLLAWLVAQWPVEKAAKLVTTSFHQLVFHAFEITFAISTLVVVLLYVYMDVRVMILQMQSEIESQRKELRLANEEKSS
jgi:hypothetical protein